jgi:malonate decarboxylase beta subunit
VPLVSAAGTLARLLERTSFIELGARARAAAVLDAGTFRELVGPFERLHSPWLAMQGIVPQEDDGVVVARGRVDGRPAVAIAIEGAFQGGSLGEVGGAKIACALELALRDCERGAPTAAVLLLETGGVRLQEANLGLALAAEIHASLVALRRHQPVVGVIAGMIGCFGGLSLAAALCSHLVVTRQARLGMNGPEVIEQEAGIAELDASDRPLVWSLMGGERRCALGLADDLVPDEADAVAAAVRAALRRGVPAEHRSERVAAQRALLARVDPSSPIDPAALVALRRGGGEP